MVRGSFLLAVAALLFVVAAVRADTPANCMYDQIAGTWEFSMSTATFDQNVNCTLPFTPATTYQVTLQYPNIATDATGAKGTWTMIYNQGYEVTIGGRVFFAFSYYTTQNGKVTSVCSQTFPGWFHDATTTQVPPAHWGCYTARKLSSSPNDINVHMTLSPQHEAKRVATLYQHDHAFIARLNASQKTWRATAYPQFEGLTIGQLEQRAGGRLQSGPTPDWARFANRMTSTEHSLLTHNSEAAPAAATEEVQAPLNPNYKAGDPLPDSFDWTNVNGVTYVPPVRDQGQCGSCYTFASAGMLECRIRILTNNLLQPSLSTQNVVSCSQYSQGCDGGFSYLIAGKFAHDFGMVDEACFPYRATNAPCSLRCSNPTFHYTATYQYIGGYYGACSEQAMREDLVKNGPFAVGIEVNAAFMHYQGGIFRDPKQEDVGVTFNPFELTNHAVVVVGYGVENGVKFWKVRNSWGPGWGEKGYIRMERGVDCLAIESMAMSAIPKV